MDEHAAELDGMPVAWCGDPSVPVLWLHGVPNSARMWSAFLERAGGVAVDLPGFGRSGKPAQFDYSIAGYDAWLERFVDHLGLERLTLVVHDWGAAGLAWAQRFPERVERLVILNAVPLLPGYHWHRTARVWRTRGAGELAMGLTTRRTLRLASREGSPRPGPLPEQWIDDVLDHFDHGTQRAILRLYRASPPGVLAAAGERLGELRCPALVVWGDRDAYIPARFADAYAAALGGAAEVVHLPDAGHWPFYDRPDIVESIAKFLRS